MRANADRRGGARRADVGEADGNPHYSYWRTVEHRATRANGDFLLSGFSQNLSMIQRRPAHRHGVVQRSGAFPNEPLKRANAGLHALRDGFALLGCTSEWKWWSIRACHCVLSGVFAPAPFGLRLGSRFN